MPKEFTDCIKRGGRVRTVTPKKGVSVPVCFPKGGGKSTAGEVRKTGKKGK